MSDITEGLGTAIEGALVGHAVEPEAGSNPKHPGKGACLNCGTKLTGAHCANCGQKAQVHRSLKAIGNDIMHGVLHLDGKLWRTLPLLAFKPGQLTLRYIEGERAKFVSPMAMFLFSVFLMFAIFQLVGLSAPADLDQEIAVDEATKALSSEAQADREILFNELEAMAEDNPGRADLEQKLKQLDGEIEWLEQTKSVNSGDDADLNFEPTGAAWFDGIVKKWRSNPSLMLYKLQANAYKFSWLLIPLSIPFVWLIFAWKRRFKAYDHAIFVTYSLSFMTLLFVTLSLLNKAGLGGSAIVMIIVTLGPLHIYKQLKNSYGLSRFSSLWRTIVLLCAINMIVTLFAQALFLIGAL